MIWGFGRKKREQQQREEEERRIREEDEARARAREDRARREAEEQARRTAEKAAAHETEDQARREAEAQARREAEAQARREAEEQARREAEEQARREAEEQARREAEDQARREAEDQARREAEEKARREAEAQARREAEEQARREAEEQARREAEEQARREAEAQARREAEEKARREAEEQARREAEAQARREAEEQARREAEEQARREAEEQARREAEDQARREAEEQARREAEEQARRAAEEKARREAEEKARREAEELARREAEEKAEPTPAAEPDAAFHHIEWGETPKKKKGGGGFFARLREGLTRSSTKISRGITEHMVTARLDDEALEYLEDVLIQSDLGVNTASDLIQSLSRARFSANPTEQEVREHFAGELAHLIEPVAVPLAIRKQPKPHVVLVVGVNGSGKTTTIGKIANQLTDWDIQVSLAAGDTFRAAAVEQLKIWGERTGCPVVARQTGADAAGLAFDAIQEARTRGDDVLLIDTAGRLQNRTELMDELKKVVRVIKKLDETAPHTVLLVIDATVGQNALQQVKVFQEMVGVTGLAVTKLDGTAKGGVVISLAQEFTLPIHFVGIGEAVEDLRPFRADEFASSLMGL
ncbi:signal recognition particle-docking protein FtsY [Roseospira goensis]|uniref:Signal recognition particle receptor FtsY n=1 Tax=Roseospira goensis TaxID=391922 RepID=A0A7W6S2I0_9PROT|nr:fused signal recognition particle receptor [Roseospira goensis]